MCRLRGAVTTTGGGTDTTAPTLSSPTASATGQTTASLGVTTNEGNGTLYWVVTTSSTAPTAAQVKLGENNSGTAAAASGSQVVSSTGAKTASATGLTAGTTYYAYFMQEDAAANQSSVASASSITTDSAPVATTFNTSTASTTLTFTNGNLTIQGNRFSGNFQGARATASASAATTRFEIKIAAIPGTWDTADPMCFCVDNGANDFHGGSPEPGLSAAFPGTTLRITGTAWVANKGGSAFASGSATFALNDWIGVEIDTGAGTVKFTHIASGVETTLTTVTGLALASYYACAGQYRDGTSTANFKGPFAGTLSSGFSAYGS